MLTQSNNTWEIEYEKLLRELCFDEAYNLAQKHIPSVVYKYYDVSSMKKEVVRKIIDGSVRFNNPSLFNDPFDSAWYYDNKKFRKSDDLFLLVKDQKTSKLSIKIMDNRKICRCACFAEQHDSILMWSHYAKGHTGICLKYDVNELIDSNHILMPIVYTNHIFFTDNMFSNFQSKKDMKEMIYPALFKSKCWEYEREWRLFDTINEIDTELYHDVTRKSSVKGVYIGVLFPEQKNNNFIKTIIQQSTIKNKGFIANMKVSKERFELGFEIT